MNVWMGSRPSLLIADFWQKEMQNWPVNYYKHAKLRKIGLGRAYDDNRHVFIVVAEYE